MHRNLLAEGAFSKNEVSLIEEAVRRAKAARGNAAVSEEVLVGAIVAEARRGARTMYELVRAATRPESAV